MTAAVVRPRHILTVRLAVIHRGPLPFPRCIHPLPVLSLGEDLIPRTFIKTAARIPCSGAVPPPTQRSTVVLKLGEPHLPPILTVRLAAIHRGPLPSPRRIHPLLVLRSSTGVDLIPRTLIRIARLHCTGGAAPPPTQRSTVLIKLGEPPLPLQRLVWHPLRALSPFPPWRPSLFLRSRTPPTTFKRAISSCTGSVAPAIPLPAPTPPLLRTRRTPSPASSGRARSGLL